MPTVTIDSTDFEVYADIGMADLYALGSASESAVTFKALGDDIKAINLVSATRLIDRQPPKGDKEVDTQLLLWPRVNVSGFTAAETLLKIADASIEMAFALSAGSDLESAQNQSQKIQMLKAGSVALQFFRGAEGQPLRFPLIISELLRGLLTSGLNSDSILMSGGISSGTGGESITTQDFGLTEGF